ncbi:hypothetical protein RHIZ_22425 [Rhizobium skierniewicense]|uniref:hypothetical protein n=1 Tax=Rhizobium TaxID=379 RepID=UPI00177AEC91|nr:MULTISPECIES: hypothetical protein [Rhizobium]MBD8688776.1 hypothetical protein [Rhizobium sp. CFBP 13644]MBD8694348.1 hypothetical protein [Rhizobium sp. CFBP 13717]MCI9868713.1 hypothetical protein [Rhizobium skierniewicense]
MAFFTDDHFSLLREWDGVNMDKTNETHQTAHASLKSAYELTGQWAEKLAGRLGPAARVKLRKSPTNQAGNFARYNWAKIYPRKDAPTNLAYTVE